VRLLPPSGYVLDLNSKGGDGETEVGRRVCCKPMDPRGTVEGA